MILATRGPQYLDPEENRQKKKLHDILGLSIIYINYLIAVCVCVKLSCEFTVSTHISV